MKVIQITLGVLLAVVAINAFGGGYYGMVGAKNIPLGWLTGSPFRSYFIPSLFLFVIVGGLCSYSSLAVFLNWRYARAYSIGCGVLMMSWICIQVLIIGYVSLLQPAVFVAGISILSLAINFKPQNIK